MTCTNSPAPCQQPRPNILFVSRYLPQPAGGGAEQRIATSLEALCGVGSVHFLLLDFQQAERHIAPTPAPSHPHAVSIGTLSTLAAQAPQEWTSLLRPSAQAKLLQTAWVTTGRIIPPSPSQSRALLEYVRHFSGVARFDLVFVMQANCAEVVTDMLPHLLAPHGRSVLDWDAAELPAMQDLIVRAAGMAKRAAGRWNIWKLRRFERRLLNRWDIAMCASPVDVAYFQSKVHGKQVYCLVNSFKAPVLAAAPARRAPGAAPRLIFVGSMAYWPNNQSILMFLRDIWPKVRSAVPTATISVVGRGPSSELKALHGSAGVEVTGEVDAVAPYYAQADIAIAPLTFSVGSAIKILESLAYKKPLVGFEIATRRHGLEDGRHVLSASNAETFAAKLIGLMGDPQLQTSLAAQGHALVVDRFAQPNVVAGLQAYLEDVLRTTGCARPSLRDPA